MESGTHEALTKATEYVKAVKKETGLRICCADEIAWKIGYFEEEYEKKVLINWGKMKGNI